MNTAFALAAALVAGVAALGLTALVLLIMMLLRSSSTRVGGR